jgi:hypothetical protein
MAGQRTIHVENNVLRLLSGHGGCFHHDGRVRRFFVTGRAVASVLKGRAHRSTCPSLRVSGCLQFVAGPPSDTTPPKDQTAASDHDYWSRQPPVSRIADQPQVQTGGVECDYCHASVPLCPRPSACHPVKVISSRVHSTREVMSRLSNRQVSKAG